MPPPFRAEQIGSLLRPESVLPARKSLKGISYEDPSADNVTDEVATVTREAVKSALQSQLQRNIWPLTNGEFPRHIFYGGFFETLEGMQIRSLPIPEGFRTDFPTTLALQRMGVKEREGVVAASMIEWTHSAYLQEYEEMKEVLSEIAGKENSQDLWGKCKLTMPSITWQHMQLKAGTAWDPDSGYTDELYFRELSAPYRYEIRTLYEAGLRNIQIDDPNLTYFASETFLGGCRKDGINPEELLDLYIRAHNLCLRDKPSDLHIGVHLCRGNFPGGTHITSGSYERFAKKIFEGLQYDTFYLEFDSERAGGFEPLRFLPREKNVVLGVVTTKFGELEDLDVLEKRVREAATVIADAQGSTAEEVLRDQIGVSPQCGFASMSAGAGKGVTEQRMWEKLELVQRLASRIWPSEI